jgi:hypothetical protein
VNLDTTSGDVLAWVGDGTTDRNETGGALFCNQVIADAEPHELRKDLRQIQTSPEWKMIVLGLTATDQGGAMFEVLGLRFEAPPNAPAPAADVAPDGPITVQVLDPAGEPVAGAVVRTDVERRNFSRSATTGADGVATVTPLKHGQGEHMVRVEKDGLAPLECVPAAGTAAEPLVLRMVSGVRYGGVVKDQDGNPVAGATVHYRARWQQPSPDMRINTGGQALTDGTGRWVSCTLPDTPHTFINVRHHAYTGGPNTMIVTDQLKAETYEAVLQKAP